jgi:hypothetical protein
MMHPKNFFPILLSNFIHIHAMEMVILNTGEHVSQRYLKSVNLKLKKLFGKSNQKDSSQPDFKIIDDLIYRCKDQSYEITSEEFLMRKGFIDKKGIPLTGVCALVEASIRKKYSFTTNPNSIEIYYLIDPVKK